MWAEYEKMRPLNLFTLPLYGSVTPLPRHARFNRCGARSGGGGGAVSSGVRRNKPFRAHCDTMPLGGYANLGSVHACVRRQSMGLLDSCP